MNLHTSKKGAALGITIGVIAGVVVIAVLVYAITYKSSTPSTAYNTPTPTPTASATAATHGIAPTSGTGTTVQNSIANTAFTQTALTVKVGDTVTWTNNDSMTHTVTSSDGGPLDSGDLKPGDIYSYTFTTAGMFSYKCLHHSFMTGTVTVQS